MNRKNGTGGWVFLGDSTWLLAVEKNWLVLGGSFVSFIQTSSQNAPLSLYIGIADTIGSFQSGQALACRVP